MDKKLTLRLNADVIERAKAYATEQGESLSRVIEDILQKLTTPKSDLPNKDLPPALRALRQTPKVELDPEVIENDPRLQYLVGKHS